MATVSVTPSHGPMTGFRIVELAANITGPGATAMMADQGADVIKVENGVGDQMRYANGYRVKGLAAIFATVNRSKRSILLDLKTPEGLDAVKRLISTADAVVQNYRPGVIERLGLGYEEVRKLREDIVYVSINGLGRTGPESGRRVYDTVVQGMACMAGVQTDPATGEPRPLNTVAADKVTALTVAQATVAALLSRERSGKGQHVEVSMLRACLAFMWPDSMGNVTWLGEGAVEASTMTRSKLVFKTKDDYIIATAMSDDEWRALVTAVGRPELANDPRFATIMDRAQRPAERSAVLADAFLCRTTAEWIPILRAADAVFAPINRPDEVHLDPQVIASGALVELDHPIGGLYRQPDHPILFEGTPASISRHPPLLGEHTEELLAELYPAGLPARRDEKVLEGDLK
jgi:crotonobetainyl-CoA:carnitine CoA-transferase CaiB-like acyl-CoA transferase